MDGISDMILSETASSHIGLDEKGFGKIRMLLDATGGLSLSQVCTVTGLESTTIQNWIKRGWVAHPNGKKYEEVHIARILIINALKECIKLEHIAQLMVYVNGAADDLHGEVIKESDLYSYLWGALQRLGQTDDLSQGGVESIVEAVIKDYEGPTPYARYRLRKTLTLMVHACVCTDVKRRTEVMMKQVLNELENPGNEMDDFISSTVIAEDNNEADLPIIEETSTKTDVEDGTSSEESRKTIAQALREWDLARVENILNDSDDDSEAYAPADSSVSRNAGEQPGQSEEKSTQKPWYFRRS